MPTGVVISTGRMVKTIRVRVPKLQTNSTIRKKYTVYENFLVHDENEACVEGDCVRIEPGHVKSKLKTHIVAEIVSPWMTGEERREVQNPEEWRARRADKRELKVARREEKRGKLKPGTIVEVLRKRALKRAGAVGEGEIGREREGEQGGGVEREIKGDLKDERGGENGGQGDEDKLHA